MRSFLLVGLFSLAAAAAPVTTPPLGVASPYNVFVFNNWNGNTSAGGRVAVGGSFSGNLTVNQQLTDPYSATYAFVAGSINSGSNVTVNNGNVYAPSGGGNVNINGSGSRTTSGGSGIDFLQAKTDLTNLSASLGGQAQSSTSTIGDDPSNTSRLLLQGTSSGLNVFSLTGSQLARTLNIQVPSGATALVNVGGTSVVDSGGGLYINGTQNNGTTNAGGLILFNFPSATQLAINQQFTASVLAPLADYNSSGQVTGNVVVNSVSNAGAFNDGAFTSNALPSATATPEPVTTSMMAGVMFLLVLFRRRLQS